MDGRDRAAVATFFAAGEFAAGETVTLGEAVAHHARVRRLSAGDLVRLTNGAGLRAYGALERVARASVDVSVRSVEPVAAQPPIHLFVPVGDRDRMLWLAEKATELGAASWRPVVFRRSHSVSPRGEGPAFADKVRARMHAALEQSAGAWMPAVHADVDVPTAAAMCGDASRFVLDAGGPPLARAAITAPAAAIVGPEGGMEAGEVAALVDAGWRRASIGEATLRFETAGIAAVAVLRAVLAPHPEG